MRIILKDLESSPTTRAAFDSAMIHIIDPATESFGSYSIDGCLAEVRMLPGDDGVAALTGIFKKLDPSYSVSIWNKSQMKKMFLI